MCDPVVQVVAGKRGARAKRGERAERGSVVGEGWGELEGEVWCSVGRCTAAMGRLRGARGGAAMGGLGLS